MTLRTDHGFFLGLVLGVVVAASAVLAISCEAEPEDWSHIESRIDCEAPNRDLAELINQCIEAANPKSDEEPEDWLSECERMMRRSLCAQRLWTCRGSEARYNCEPWYLCDAAPPRLQSLCIASGWVPDGVPRPDGGT